MHTKIAWELNRTESHHLPCRMWLWEKGRSDLFYWLKICGQNVSLFLFYFECIYLLSLFCQCFRTTLQCYFSNIYMLLK